MLRLSLLCCILSSVSAFDTTVDLVSYEISGRLSTQFNYMDMRHADFRLGELKDSWDEAARYELDFIYLMPVNKHLEFFGGGYLFWENRDYHKGIATIDYDILGFGWEGGTIWYPLKNGSMRQFNLGIMPFARFGIGSQDAVFSGIPYDPDYADGYTNRERWELALGIDLRANLTRNMQVTLGGGVQAWYSDETPAEQTDEDGNVIETLHPLSFKGDDAWVRVGFGFLF